MTRKKLQLNIIFVTLVYALFILIGLFTFFHFQESDGKNNYFNAFKDLILLWVAIPAAYLGDCFQRRSAFTTALREMWGNLIESVNEARQFTFETNPNQAIYGQTLKLLSKSIDEVRGVYSNIGETKTDIGLYPYESLKEIQKLVSEMGFTVYDKATADSARCLIDHHWGLIKSSFLFEFDRPEPTVTNTKYKKAGKFNHWENKDSLPPKKDKEK